MDPGLIALCIVLAAANVFSYLVGVDVGYRARMDRVSAEQQSLYNVIGRPGDME